MTTGEETQGVCTSIGSGESRRMYERRSEGEGVRISY